MTTYQYPIRLIFDPRIGPVVRSRMKYAFRVFAAIYGHDVVEEDGDRPVRDFLYADANSANGLSQEYIRVPARYDPTRSRNSNWSHERVSYAGENLYLFHGLDPVTHQPDWLGEIFDWLSGSWEKGIETRDAVGRIADAEMIFSRIGLPTWKPQAALHMAWLEHLSRRESPGFESLPKAPSPVPGWEHFLVCTHDVDFCYTNISAAIVRLLKNIGIAGWLYRDASYFKANLGMLLDLCRGARIGDYIAPLISRLAQAGLRSTFFIVPLRQHRRDPRYKLADLLGAIQTALASHFPVELHASYKSVVDCRTLRAEVSALEFATGKKITGSRQHWLRFSDQQLLFEEVEGAKLLFDSSVGFADTVGFRNGACFAFPPYNFKEEKAHEFLEIPLAIMDGGLFEIAKRSGEAPQNLADRVLDESRKRGWGGVAILWHNPVEALSVPQAINDVFWRCAAKRAECGENWLSTDEFLAVSLRRYQRAGLLTTVDAGEMRDSVDYTLPETSFIPKRALNVDHNLA